MANKFLTDLARLTQPGQLEPVKTGLLEANSDLADAELNLNTARLALAANDLSGSFSMAYLAARKCVQAVLAAHGMRVKSGNKTHLVFVSVTKASIFTQELWVRLDWMRSVRNNADYPRVDSPKTSIHDCEEALAAAQLMLDDTSRILGNLR